MVYCDFMLFRSLCNNISPDFPLLSGRWQIEIYNIWGFTSVKIHILVFWIVTPCSLVVGHWRFEERHSLHLNINKGGGKMSLRNVGTTYQTIRCLYLHLLEDGSNKFFRNVGNIYQTTPCLYIHLQEEGGSKILWNVGTTYQTTRCLCHHLQ
jgi:hypothetical protein